MIEVHVHEQLISDCLDVFIVRKGDGLRAVLHMTDQPFRFRWDDLGPLEASVSDSVLEPTFVLPYDSGRALLDALTRHYHGAEDTRALRRDYDAERHRVDMQNAVISDIAVALARRSFQ
jgi:hypothetical protein